MERSKHWASRLKGGHCFYRPNSEKHVDSQRKRSATHVCFPEGSTVLWVGRGILDSGI